MNRIEFHAMGSRILAVVDTPVAEPLLEQAPVWFEEWEQTLSRFRTDSELSRLNCADRDLFPVSQTLWDVLQAARGMETWTGGLVRSTILDALIQAGYDRSFDRILSGPEDRLDRSDLRLEAAAAVLEIPALSTAVGWDESTHSLSLPASIHLDFGGIAKGWAAQQAVDRLAATGPALVDAGGDIAISGPRCDGSPWPIGVRDPFQPDRHFETLQVKNGGVATSGTDYHHWLQDGQTRHHIIDPRTGLSAETDILTATVLATDAIRAEAAAKTALILGSIYGLAWLEADPNLAGILVLQDGEVQYSRRMETFLWKEI